MKLDFKQHYAQVIGLRAKFSQGGHLFDAFGNECDENGNLIPELTAAPKTSDELAVAVAARVEASTRAAEQKLEVIKAAAPSFKLPPSMALPKNGQEVHFAQMPGVAPEKLAAQAPLAIPEFLAKNIEAAEKAAAEKMAPKRRGRPPRKAQSEG